MKTTTLQLHNVEALVSAAGLPHVMSRVPPSLYEGLHPWTVRHFQTPANTELRFHTTALPVEIHVTVQPEPVAAAVYFGDYLFREQTLLPGENVIEISEDPRLDLLRRGGTQQDFAPDLIRVLFLSISSAVSFDGITSAGVLTPPAPRDLPKLRYLAYGSSITHGFRASSPALTYAYQAAHRMHADLQNLGVGGSAYLEEALGQYIADSCDFDLFTAEISVNLLNQGCSAEEFYRRANAFLRKIDEKHPRALKAVISILPSFWDVGLTRPAAVSTAQSYRQITEHLCRELDGHYLFLDGRELMSMNNLSCDLIHPSDLGMNELGRNIADRLIASDPERFRV